MKKLPIAERPFNQKLGAVVRNLRTQRGLSQEAIGSKLGVTFQQVQKYEKGINRISVETLMDISGAIGVSVADILKEVQLETPASIPITLSRKHLEAANVLARCSDVQIHAVKKMVAAFVSPEQEDKIIHVVEGKWSGYKKGQEKIVHRLVTDDPDKYSHLTAIQFGDASTLDITVRAIARGEELKELDGYSRMIEDAVKLGVPYVTVEEISAKRKKS